MVQRTIHFTNALIPELRSIAINTRRTNSHNSNLALFTRDNAKTSIQNSDRLRSSTRHLIRNLAIKMSSPREKINVRRVQIDSVGAVLDGRVFSIGERPSSLAVVLVHQYSLLGGSQDLMRGMVLELCRLGYSCVTFNMRGVGNSTGRSTIQGLKEVDDVIAACEWAAQNVSSDLALVGSSAGAPIAGSAIDKVEAIKAYVGVGYTFGRMCSVLFGKHFKTVLESPKPKLFVLGTRDGFTSVGQLESRVASAKLPCSTRLVEGVGHFELEGPAFDETVAGFVHDFVQENLGK